MSTRGLIPECNVQPLLRSVKPLLPVNHIHKQHRNQFPFNPFDGSTHCATDSCNLFPYVHIAELSTAVEVEIMNLISEHFLYLSEKVRYFLGTFFSRIIPQIKRELYRFNRPKREIHLSSLRKRIGGGFDYGKCRTHLVLDNIP